jgi:hypothetical protein
MKNPKDIDLNINKMRALTPQVSHMVIEGDCFAKEWSGTDPICSSCSLYIMCAAMYGKIGLEAKRKEVNTQFNNGGAYLDQADFSKINRKAVADIIRNLAASSTPMTYQELVTNVMKSANITNSDVAVSYCAVLMAEFGIVNNQGYLYVG